MALSLDSIYRPLNEFFSQKFGGDTSVTFRFAHVPHAFADSDFLDPQHPDWGPMPAIAVELCSTVVDGVPRLDADGRTVWVSTSRLSDLYHDEILGPALPFVPASVTDGGEKQALMDAFNAAKTDAIAGWEHGKALSVLEGPDVWFRRSNAMPEKWWDRTDAGVWTHQSFEVKGVATAPGQPAQPPDQLLRMKIDDTTLRSILQSHVGAPAPPQPAPPAFHPAVTLSAPTRMMARPVFTAALAGGAPAAVAAVTNRPAASVAVYNTVAPGIASFPFRQRLEVESMLAANAPTQSVATSDATISFDYSVVNVARSWFHDAFIDNSSWYIPGQGKGQLSANDGHGLPAKPVGFVAVKSLSIQAPWTPEDITNLEQSVQFGPFNFDSKVVNGAIGHDGIQIVGWMLQALPDLPPNAIT